MTTQGPVGLILTLTLLMGLPTALAGGVIFSEDFDDGDIGDWTVTTTGDAVFEVSALVCVSPPYSVHMRSTGDYMAMGVSPVYGGLNLARKYKVSFRFRIPHDNNHWFEVFNNHQTYLVIDDHTNLKCYESPPPTSYFLATLNAGQWYLVELEVNPAAETYDVFVDGQFTKTCPMWIHGGWETTFQLGDRADGSTDNGEAYWDDIVITQGPPGDLDYDCDVDLDDFTVFAAAMSGPGQPIAPPDDPAADLDLDTDCDLADFAVFGASFTGPAP